MKSKLDKHNKFYHREFFPIYEIKENQGRITPAARQLTRKRVNVKAVLRWGETVAEGSTDNLSLKGAYIRTKCVIPIMERIVVELFHAGDCSPSVSVSAQAVRRDENGIGVEFKDLNHETLDKLNSFVVSLGGR